MSVAAVRTPPHDAVAAIERASISATPLSCPSEGFEPSLLGKLRVVCLIERALFEGTSPAPKQGPQKQGLNTAPASRSVF